MVQNAHCPSFSKAQERLLQSGIGLNVKEDYLEVFARTMDEYKDSSF